MRSWRSPARVWSGLRYSLGTFATALVTLVVLVLLIAAVLLVPVVGLGLVLLPPAAAGLRGLADQQRHRAGAFLGTTIPARYRPRSGSAGARLRQVLTDRGTWRDLGSMTMNIVTGVPLGVLTLVLVGNAVLGIVTASLWWAFPPDARPQVLDIPVTDWGRALTLGPALALAAAGLTIVLVPLLAHGHARLSRATLSPSAADRLAERVDVLTRTRAEVVDGLATELRRIERDLHDGTQARLVTISMRLGLAREALSEDPEAAARLIQDAQEDAEGAMAELRDVIRTTYPPILADQGLAGALAALGARSPVPVRVDVPPLGVLPAPIEAAAYFTVVEALTNVAKHSRATRATVRLVRDAGRLLVEVSDDGVGGADGTAGTGIDGIRRRIAALDGEVRLVSPPGGPTVVSVELPCGS